MTDNTLGVPDFMHFVGSVVAYAFSDAGPYEHVDTTDAEVEFVPYFGWHPCADALYFVGPDFSYIGARR